MQRCDLAEIVSNGGVIKTLYHKKHPHRKNGEISLKFLELNSSLEGWNIKYDRQICQVDTTDT